MLLGLEGDWLDVVLSERLVRREDLTSFGGGGSTNCADRRVADQGTGDVRERR